MTAKDIESPSDGRPLPLVALVTPVYNGASYLRETIDCVQAETYPNLVHGLLDNASTDESASIIAAYKGRRVPIVYARNPETIPMIDNWNAGLGLVPRNAAYFRILPADDLMVPSCIEKMVGLAERHPEVDLIGCQELAGGELMSNELPTDREVFDGRAIVRGSLMHAIRGFPHLHCVFRIPATGLPDPFYVTEYYNTPLLSIDTDAAMSVLSEGPYGVVHEPLVITRLHDESTTSKVVAPIRLQLWSELQLIDRWGPKVFDTKEEYLRCRQRHLRYYYRHMLLWRARGQHELFDQHYERLHHASALPTLADYARAVAEWPFLRFGRRAAQFAARLGVPPTPGRLFEAQISRAPTPALPL